MLLGNYQKVNDKKQINIKLKILNPQYKNTFVI